MPPMCYVLAGPNGSGKSTAAYSLIPAGIEVINPDDIARQLRVGSDRQEVILQQTNDMARQRIEACLAVKVSFAVETNLYDAQTWHYFLTLQAAGYTLSVIFLCTSQLQILVERVKNRYQEGGHFVREDIIRERYMKRLS